MSFPFTLTEFLEMIASYNTAIWPMQVLVYQVGIVAVVFAIRGTNISSRVVSFILAFYWIWIGILFNGIYFTKLSSNAVVFAVLFVIQGIILLAAGFFRKKIAFAAKADAYGLVGGLLVLYGMVGYPVIEHLLGRGYPQSLAFGLVPCPTTIFTLGLLLWSKPRLPKYVLIIPFLYSLAGILVAAEGIVEDYGLTAAGLVTVALILYRDRSKAGVAKPAPGYS